MKIEDHRLLSEYPEFKEAFFFLKMQDQSFHNLYEEFLKVEFTLIRIESGFVSASPQCQKNFETKCAELKTRLLNMLKEQTVATN